MESAAIALVWWVEIVSDGIRYVGAEIPPAGAPTGFDSAAGEGCIVRPFIRCAAPLRMTQ